MNALLDALGKLGYVLDTPGAYARGALGGQFGDRLSGREMLQNWGVLGENKEGLDVGDVGGFAAELATDPLNWLGALGLGRISKAAGAAKAANAESMALREMGAMPEEIAALTKAKPYDYVGGGKHVVQESAVPLKMFHGSQSNVERFQDLDPAMTGLSNDPGWYGQAVYTSADPSRANGYAESIGKYMPESDRQGPRVLFGYADMRNPISLYEEHMPAEVFASLPTGIQEKLSLAGYSPEGYSVANSKIFSDELVNAGYDGIIRQDYLLGSKPTEVALFDNAKLYAPYIAPSMKPVPSTNPLLAAMLGYNAGVAPGRMQWQAEQ